MAKQCDKLNCNNPQFGGGYCKNHQYLRAKKPVDTTTKDQLNKWFYDRRLQMTGNCLNCNRNSSKDSDIYYKYSIAHILPKSETNGFPSVATDPNNWLELCIDCHTRYDSNWENARKMEVWQYAKFKFSLFKHKVTEKHKKALENFVNA